jgi:hypothetical protein
VLLCGIDVILATKRVLLDLAGVVDLYVECHLLEILVVEKEDVLSVGLDFTFEEFEFLLSEDFSEEDADAKLIQDEMDGDQDLHPLLVRRRVEARVAVEEANQLTSWK